MSKEKIDRIIQLRLTVDDKETIRTWEESKSLRKELVRLYDSLKISISTFQASYIISSMQIQMHKDTRKILGRFT